MKTRRNSKTTSLRFECTGCGKCCTRQGEYAYVYLDDDEVRTLATHLDLSPSVFEWHYTFIDAYGWRQLAFDGDHCSFLDRDTNLCTVYEARPTQCRTFPFWRELIGPRGWTRRARKLCEGIGRGPTHPADEVEASMLEMEARDER